MLLKCCVLSHWWESCLRMCHLNQSIRGSCNKNKLLELSAWEYFPPSGPLRTLSVHPSSPILHLLRCKNEAVGNRKKKNEIGCNSSVKRWIEGSGMVDSCTLEKEKQTPWGERIRGIKRKGREQDKLGWGGDYLSVFSEEKARNGNATDVTVEYSAWLSSIVPVEPWTWSSRKKKPDRKHNVMVCGRQRGRVCAQSTCMSEQCGACFHTDGSLFRVAWVWEVSIQMEMQMWWIALCALQGSLGEIGSVKMFLPSEFLPLSQCQPTHPSPTGSGLTTCSMCVCVCVCVSEDAVH